MKTHSLLIATAILVASCSSDEQSATGSSTVHAPIIDMHMHAYPPNIFGPPSPNPISGVASTDLTEAEIRRLTLEAMERNNIVRAVLSGPLDVVGRWLEEAPDRFLGSPHFPRFSPFLDLDTLRELYRSKELGAMAEITSQYSGMTPSDERLEPYLALAEELDVPVGIHVGLSGQGVTYTEHPDFRIANGRPLLLEPMLVRHPDLRVYVMHAGWPFLDEMKAILWTHPQVYVDIAVINWFIPRPEFHRYLRELVEAGFGDRIMFGSDQMIWPDAIDLAIEGIESASFLSESQKRDIFYNNAARFLRIDGAVVR
jgi:predicted TIM-barrel fold metal-dependent hydrolase